MVFPNVLMCIIADYAPEFVQKFLQEDAEHEDLIAAQTHVMWCDVRHIRVETSSTR